MRVLGCINCCCKVIKLSSSWEIWEYVENYYMICRSEVESRLVSLAKHKKEWKRMGVNYLMELVEKGVLKKLRVGLNII